MRLLSLRLQNFRQHVDTHVEFTTGLTGIIGPNGSGKSTLLEAIAWALYGNAAARGTRETIRSLRAAPRAKVRVELEFVLAGHRYHVVRSPSNADCFLDGGDTPIASTTSGVTELMQRRLGMTRTEFFHTYFTGQKELDVMATMGPLDRARFLSRVLGYDRLTDAQELARDRRRLLAAEASGLRHGMPDVDVVHRALDDATARVAAADARVVRAMREHTETTHRLDAALPAWREAQARRDAARDVEAAWQLAVREVDAQVREQARLAQEVRAAEAAARECEPLRAQLGALEGVRAQLAAQDALAVAEGTRARLAERLQQSTAQRTAIDVRLAQLAPAQTMLPDLHTAVPRLRMAASDAERAFDEQRTVWARDRQEAETRLQALLTQHAELAEQSERLEGLGEDSPCPTCGKPLGARWQEVLDTLRDQLETVKADGKYYRQRSEQLAKAPAQVDAAEEARKQAQQELAQAERRLQKVQAAVDEATRLEADVSRLDAQEHEARAQLTALPSGYDSGLHARLRRDLNALQELATQVARLNALAERADGLRIAAQEVASSAAAAIARRDALAAQRATSGVDEGAFAAVQQAWEQASTAVRAAELEMVAARAERSAAGQALETAGEALAERTRRQAALDAVDAERRLHEELDRVLGELRGELTLQLRPELSEIASEYLAELTDGRYRALEFDEDYSVLVHEDGAPKPVISGGEEDLCNLVLRLAISQMIAERAGQAFSLLVLDEVFGSLDESRRASVVELLRRLHDRFEQVIVITHIEQVREGLDRLIEVRYDEARGCSVVADADVVGRP